MTIEQQPQRVPWIVAVALAAAVLSSAGCASTTAAERVSEERPPAAQSMAAGDEAARRGDFERALLLYLQAADAEDTAEIWLRVGAAANRLDDAERALGAYLRVLELDPLQPDALEGAGLKLMAIGNAAAASANFNQVLQIDADRWRSHNALGIIADRAGEHGTAISHYESALRIYPGSALVLNNLGYSRYLDGDLDQAARDLYAATQADPEHSRAWANLALVYAHQGWYADAVRTLSRVTDEAAAYNDVGYVAFQRGDLEEAAELLSEAVRVSPTFFETAYKNLEAVQARLRGSMSMLPARNDEIRDQMLGGLNPVLADER